MFDRNIFLYLEDIDLCKRLKDNHQKIYICRKAKIKHLNFIFFTTDIPNIYKTEKG